MVNNVLVNYFRTGLAKGNSVQILRKTLIDSGWPVAEVDAAKNEVRIVEKKPLIEKKFNEKPMKNDFVIQKRPVGISVVAILYWVMAGLGVIVGFIFAFGVGALSFIFGGQGPSSILLILPFLILSLIPLFIGIGIWKGKDEWRAFAAAIMIPGFVGTISLIFLSFNLLTIVGLLVGGFILYYLLLDKKSNEFFRPQRPIGVSVSAMLYLITMVFILIGFIILIASMFLGGGSISANPILFIASLLFAIFFFFLAKGLNRAKKSWRLVAIIFNSLVAIVSVIFGISSMNTLGGYSSGITYLSLGIQLAAIIFWIFYLASNKKVSRFFNGI